MKNNAIVVQNKNIMKFDLFGKIKNTKLRKQDVLVPLFEAIDNSIDSIKEKYHDNIQDGEISISIVRTQLQLESESDQYPEGKISGFIIYDNGVGFTDNNYDSFNTAESLYKRSVGGKGNGRFLWLKAFEKVLIKSQFSKNGNNYYREFSFALSNSDGVKDIKSPQIITDTTTWCEIDLQECKNDYINDIPAKPETIATKIAYHFIKPYLMNVLPDIKIIDNGKTYSIFDCYKELIDSQFDSVRFQIKNESFTLTQGYIKYKSNEKNEVILCAKDRPVKSIPITSSYITNLPKYFTLTFNGSEDRYLYIGYLSSEFLDNQVTSERDEFTNIPHRGEDIFALDTEITWEDITDTLQEKLINFLGEYLNQAKEEKIKTINSYVNNISPQYKYIIRDYPSELDNIQPGLSDKDIEKELNQIAFTLRKEYRNDVEKIIDDLQHSSPNEIDIHDISEKARKYLQKGNEIGKAELAQYIIQRKIILEMLDSVIKVNKQDKFETEELFHNFIFPIKSDSDEISYQEHNLWVIDEKLAYNSYIASDLAFSKLKSEEISDKKRPDLFIGTFATIELNNEMPPYKSLDIFEFKRPMRDDYTDDENPIKQLIDYLEIIREKRAKTKDKRNLEIFENGIIYCHAICDITPKLQRILIREECKQIGSEKWYMKYHEPYRALIEIKDIELLIHESKTRNKILFDKLGVN